MSRDNGASTMRDIDERNGTFSSPVYERPPSREGIVYRDSLAIIDDPIIYKQVHHLKTVCGITEDRKIENHIKLVLQNGARGEVRNHSVSHQEIYENVHRKETVFSVPVAKKGWVTSLRNLLLRKGRDSNASGESVAVEERTDFVATKWRLTPLNKIESLSEDAKKDERDEVYNFDTLYRQVILKVIDLIGELPASESHHHNWKQGLLQHSLEVGTIALKQAKSSDLKAIGMNDLEQSRRIRYQYAAFVVGLLHDIGKAITDMVIHCDTDASGPIRNKLVRWNPIINDLHSFLQKGGYKRYFIDMNPASKYIERSSRFTRHEKLASTLLARVLTPESQHFLSTAPDIGFGLYEKVTAILSGNKHADGYLTKALATGERISTHLSFSKTLSAIHLNDRNTSIADLLISELAASRDEDAVKNQIVMIGGNAIMRYPQILDVLVRRIENKSPGTTLSGYTFDELANMLVDHNYIFRSESGKTTLYYTPIKPKSVKKKIEWVDDGDGFPVLMLTDPTFAFGSNVPPKGVSGKLDMPGGKQLEYRGDNEVRFDLEKESSANEILTIEEQFEREVVTTYEALFSRTEKEYASKAIVEDKSEDSPEASTTETVKQEVSKKPSNAVKPTTPPAPNEAQEAPQSNSTMTVQENSSQPPMLDTPPPYTEEEFADMEAMSSSYEDDVGLYSNNDSLQQQLMTKSSRSKPDKKASKFEQQALSDLPMPESSNLPMSELDTETEITTKRKKKDSAMRRKESKPTNGAANLKSTDVEKAKTAKIAKSGEVPLEEPTPKVAQPNTAGGTSKTAEVSSTPISEIEPNPDLEASSYADHNLPSEWQYKLLYQLINEIKKGKLFGVDEEIRQDRFNRDVIKFVSDRTSANKQNPYHVVAVLNIIWEKVSKDGVFVLKSKRSSS